MSTTLSKIKAAREVPKWAPSSEAARLMRVMDFEGGRKSTTKAVVVQRKLGGRVIEPQTDGLGDRMNVTSPVWRPMSMRVISDAQMKRLLKSKDAGRLINPELDKLKEERAQDYIGTYYGWYGTIMPEYEMREPMAVVDNEVYVKQAVNRKLSLMLRNGYEILSDRALDAKYIQERLTTIEYVTDRKWDSFLKSILRCLLLQSNCFVLKLRKTDAAGVPRKKGRKPPVAGYSIIPAHTVQPYLENGKITKWRRFFDTGKPYEDIDLDDIIHFKWDVKPGHIFGTPRTVGVRDDIFALRRLEENIELLFINHLFPLFHVKVGTEDAPCTYTETGASEIDLVKYQIENMPKEGVFVTDERVEVKAVGAEGKALAFEKLVQHFKTRVYIGLGMSALDMGEGADATRATADNISQNLKDSIKADLDEFSGMVEMYIFKDLFLEANYSTSVQKATARTQLLFHEIDLDNRIKEETHVMALFNSHLITETEARKRLKLKSIKGAENKELDRGNLHFDLHVVRLVKETEKAKQQEMVKAQAELLPMQTKEQQKLLKAQGDLAETQAKVAMQGAKAEEVKAGAKERVLAAEAKHAPTIAAAKVSVIKARGGAPQRATAKKTTQTSKAVSNKMRPTNQHGSNPGPTKAKSAQEQFEEDLYLKLSDAVQTMEKDGVEPSREWRRISAEVIEGVTEDHLSKIERGEIGVSDGDSYTRQVRDGISRLKLMVGETTDPELLAVLVGTMYDEADENELQREDPEPVPSTAG